LHSSVLKWPAASDVRAAAAGWLTALSAAGRIVAGGYFGSYARGDAGVGSDLDLFVAVPASAGPAERRAVQFDTTGLPVPADLLAYTVDELRELLSKNTRFARVLSEEAVWVVKLP
jgi:predicted nucleotidyltransferase